MNRYQKENELQEDSATEDLSDLSNLTDSSGSTSSNVIFEVNEPVILELHDLKKDDPAGQPPASNTEAKVKKHKKQKKLRKDAAKTLASFSSSSPSEHSLPTLETTREEFFDAHESYHGMPGNQLAPAPTVAAPSPVAAIALAQQHSEHGQDQKIVVPDQNSTSVIRQPSSAITIYFGAFRDSDPSPIITMDRMTQKLTVRRILKDKGVLGQENLSRRRSENHILYAMEAQPTGKSRLKSKSKKLAPKPKTSKKHKTESNKGPTCSMFLAELTRKLGHKRKHEEDEEQPPHKSIVHSIIDSLTNALPVIFSRKTPEKKESPIKIETLQSFAPELYPNDTLDIPPLQEDDVEMIEAETSNAGNKKVFNMPKMPLVSSDVLKIAEKRRVPVVMEDAAVNTGGDHDLAGEIARHVGTLRKISLIAEEFNQKTAKNLKEIVDSVQEDLIKKLEEIQEEQRLPEGRQNN